MFSDEEKEDLKKVMNHFGEKNQVKKLAEECAEFLEKYLKNDYYGGNAEIADIKFLCDQFYVESVFIRQEYDNKKKRTFDRMESGYYEGKK